MVSEMKTREKLALHYPCKFDSHCFRQINASPLEFTYFDIRNGVYVKKPMNTDIYECIYCGLRTNLVDEDTIPER